MSLVSASLATARGLRAEFNDVFRVRGAEVKADTSKVMGFWGSDGAFEVYHGFDSPPTVKPWIRGQSRSRSSFRASSRSAR